MLWNWRCFHDKIRTADGGQPNLFEMGNCKMDWVLKSPQPVCPIGDIILLGSNEISKKRKDNDVGLDQLE